MERGEAFQPQAWFVVDGTCEVGPSELVGRIRAGAVCCVPGYQEEFKC